MLLTVYTFGPKIVQLALLISYLRWTVLSQRRSDNRAPLRHYFYIPRPRSHINLYIEYNFNYMKGAKRRTDVVPPLVLSSYYVDIVMVLNVFH